MNFRFFFLPRAWREARRSIWRTVKPPRERVRITHAQLWINDRKKRTTMTSSEFRLLNPLLNGRFPVSAIELRWQRLLGLCPCARQRIPVVI